MREEHCRRLPAKLASMANDRLQSRIDEPVFSPRGIRRVVFMAESLD
jgi:hypothetical protein